VPTFTLHLKLLFSQTTLYFQGFEGASFCTENWGYTGGNIDATYSKTGTRSARVGRSGESNTLTFNTVNVSGMAGLNLQIYHSVKGGTGPGMDVREGAIIRVSLNGGAYTTIARVAGFGDHSYNWSDNTGGSSSASSGCTVYQAPNPLNYPIPAGTNTIAVQVITVGLNTSNCATFNAMMNSLSPTASNYDRDDEGFYIDDVRITTTSSTFTNVWLGNTSQDWHTCSNWSFGAVPTDSHHVLINQSGTTTNNCRVSNNNAVCNSLTLTTANSNTQDLEVRNGRTLTINWDVTINRTANGTSNLKFEADSGVINIAGNLTARIVSGITSAAQISILTESIGQINVTGDVLLENNANSTNPYIDLLISDGGPTGKFTCNNLTLKGNGSANPDNVKIEFSQTNVADYFEVNGNFLMNGNSKFDATKAGENTTIIFRGNYTNNVNETQMIEGSTGRFTFSGGANQTINTNGFNEVFNSITVTKSGGNVILNAPLEIKSNLNFLSGDINSGLTNLLIFRAGSNHTSASDASHANGPVRKIGNTGFIFPVGNGIHFRKAEISAPSNLTDHFTCQYFLDNPDNVPYNRNSKDPTLDHISACEYWQLDRTNGTSDVSVTLSWNAATSGGVTSLNDLRVARWNGAMWKDHGNGGTTGNTNAGTVITSAPVTAFSPFTLSSSNPFTNPLPIELLSFTAEKNESSVLLRWTTATEVNNDYFELEKSTDAINFQAFAKIKGAGYSNQLLNYSHEDKHPYRGYSYYRLKQVDYDGAYSYSEIKTIYFDDSENEQIRFHPNPTDGVVNITNLNDSKDYVIKVYDLTGKLIFSKNKSHNNTFTFSVQDLASGFYTLQILSENQTILVDKIIKE
jgi:hypothetical protein